MVFKGWLIIVNPATGVAVKNNYPDVKGSPFFMEEWQYALIKLNDGRRYDLTKVLLDISNQRSLF